MCFCDCDESVVELVGDGRHLVGSRRDVSVGDFSELRQLSVGLCLSALGHEATTRSWKLVCGA
jgi:hypothetical protein